jgi:hypothetical protein
MVKILDNVQTLETLAKALKKPCMFISIHSDPLDYCEIEQAAPYLEGQLQVMSDGYGYIVFDTEEEMREYYLQTVGDDGPTSKNDYDGNCRVYALTCNAEGRTQNENT